VRVCVTGGLGFIGGALARLLVRDGHDLVALDNLSLQVHRDPDASMKRFPGRVLVGDVRDPRAVAEAIHGCDLVVHLAAETGVGQSMMLESHYRAVNVEGSVLVAQQALRADAGMIFVSSRAVYGQGAFECVEHGRGVGTRCCGLASPAPSREDDEGVPVSVYGETKLEAEHSIRELFGDRGWYAVLRPQNVTGAGQALHNPYTGVLAAFAARLRAGLPPQVYGTGEQTRDIVDVADAARVLAWVSAERGVGPSGLTLNVGSGERTTLLELAQLALACVPSVAAPIEHRAITRLGDIDHACADMTRADLAGAPRAEVSVSESVAAFVQGAMQEEAVDPAIWDRALAETQQPSAEA
jgi:dTDP-L-rhamnose 4-epimerase